MDIQGFEASEGSDASDMLSTVGWVIEDRDRPDIESLDDDVTTAWREVQVQRRGGSDEPMDFSYERWRIDLVREDGDWKLCEFSQR